MSYHTEHKRLQPVLDLARRLDIASNPAPEAVFEAGSAGFQIWCTPQDHPRDPQGWNLAANRLIPGTFSKPCGYAASVHWLWDGESIVGLALETDAYDLARLLPGFVSGPARRGRKSIHNRPVDIAWAKTKTRQLFRQAGVPCPPIVIG
jgi:hypothetical protein